MSSGPPFPSAPSCSSSAPMDTSLPVDIPASARVHFSLSLVEGHLLHIISSAEYKLSIGANANRVRIETLVRLADIPRHYDDIEEDSDYLRDTDGKDIDIQLLNRVLAVLKDIKIAKKKVSSLLAIKNAIWKYIDRAYFRATKGAGKYTVTPTPIAVVECEISAIFDRLKAEPSEDELDQVRVALLEYVTDSYVASLIPLMEQKVFTRLYRAIIPADEHVRLPAKCNSTVLAEAKQQFVKYISAKPIIVSDEEINQHEQVAVATATSSTSGVVAQVGAGDVDGRSAVLNMLHQLVGRMDKLESGVIARSAAVAPMVHPVSTPVKKKVAISSRKLFDSVPSSASGGSGGVCASPSFLDQLAKSAGISRAVGDIGASDNVEFSSDSESESTATTKTASPIGGGTSASGGGSVVHVRFAGAITPGTSYALLLFQSASAFASYEQYCRQSLVPAMDNAKLSHELLRWSVLLDILSSVDCNGDGSGSGVTGEAMEYAARVFVGLQLVDANGDYSTLEAMVGKQKHQLPVEVISAVNKARLQTQKLDKKVLTSDDTKAISANRSAGNYTRGGRGANRGPFYGRGGRGARGGNGGRGGYNGNAVPGGATGATGGK